MQIVENSYTTLRAIGKDELWLQEWITEKPSRLGLGDLVIKNSELIHYKNKGGRLDLLAYRGALDTYYEIEVMLGECDADHGFRTLDYWARERLKKPNARHVAVLIAEDLSGRYKTIIETLPQFLPFIAIKIKVLRLEGTGDICTIDTAIVAQPDDLIIDSGDEPDNSGSEGGQPRDRAWWEANSNPAFLARANGVYVYLPGGQNGAEDAPSDFYNSVKQRLEESGMEPPGWTYKYNAGANPISFPIPLDRATHSVVRDILKEAYDAA